MSKAAQQTNAKAADARHVTLVSHTGLIAAIAALAGASCCALPLAMAWLGLAGAWIANLEPFVAYRLYITSFAVIVIAVGWVVAARRRVSWRTLVVLGIASVLVGVALLMAHYEAELTRYLMAMRRK